MKIKAKSVDFFKSISIPGFPQIVTTEGYFLKAILILLTLLTFALGFKSISLAATDYYKFDVITNIARVTQNNVTFPAITVCTAFHYNSNHYRNRSVVKTDMVEIRTDNISRIKNFLNFAFTGYKLLSVSDHLDSFKTSRGIPICKFWTLAFFSFFSSFSTDHGRINFFPGFFHSFFFNHPFPDFFRY